MLYLVQILLTRRLIYNISPASFLISTGIAIFAVLLPKFIDYLNKQPLVKPSKSISEKTVENALAIGQPIFIKTFYLEGISTFTDNCMAVLNLLPEELRISEVNPGKTKDPIRTASLPYFRIIGADVIELPKRAGTKSSRDTALYFVVNYLDEAGTEKQLLFNKVSGYHYALFMNVLEKRIPHKEAVPTETPVEQPTHIDL